MIVHWQVRLAIRHINKQCLCMQHRYRSICYYYHSVSVLTPDAMKKARRRKVSCSHPWLAVWGGNCWPLCAHRPDVCRSMLRKVRETALRVQRKENIVLLKWHGSAAWCVDSMDMVRAPGTNKQKQNMEKNKTNHFGYPESNCSCQFQLKTDIQFPFLTRAQLLSWHMNYEPILTTSKSRKELWFSGGFTCSA